MRDSAHRAASRTTSLGWRSRISRSTGTLSCRPSRPSARQALREPLRGRSGGAGCSRRSPEVGGRLPCRSARARRASACSSARAGGSDPRAVVEACAWRCTGRRPGRCRNRRGARRSRDAAAPAPDRAARWWSSPRTCRRRARTVGPGRWSARVDAQGAAPAALFHRQVGGER